MLEYLQGFFDGEGYIGVVIGKSKRTLQLYPRLMVVNTHKPSLVLFQDFFNLGTIAPRKKPTKTNHKQAYQWYVQDSDGVQKVLTTLEPGLLQKKEQAQLMLEFLSFGSKYDYGKSFPPDIQAKRYELALLLQQLKH